MLEESKLISKFGAPNCVTDIFKVRSGKWTQVRIWSIIDLGRMKKKDLFVTDAGLEPIENFFLSTAYDIQNWECGEYEYVKKLMKELNEE